MAVFAAVMTGKGTGAISTIQLFGDTCEAILKKIFKPAGTKPLVFKLGMVYLGTIYSGDELLDQVTVGCEEPDNFAINCHGNPLIVEAIMELLRQHGAKLLTSDQLLSEILTAQKTLNAIQIEAKLTSPKAKTIEGTKILANQADAGLSRTATEWLDKIDSVSLDEITTEAEQILKTSQTAKLIINGCTAVITGPPNSGKSTLLNCLSGREKAIVTDIKGTTRDWISSQCQIDSLHLNLVDTAGLDEKLTRQPENTIEKAAQEKTIRILKESDLLLLILDNSQPYSDIDKNLLDKVAVKKVLTVLNKSDLPGKLDISRLPVNLTNTVQISAKIGTGIEDLKEKIRQICGCIDFDLKSAVCFTSRQESLLKELAAVRSKSKALSIITELLKGRLHV